MRSDRGFRFSVFGFQKLRRETSPLSVQLSPAEAPFQISNLKSQIRVAAGGRL